MKKFALVLVVLVVPCIALAMPYWPVHPDGVIYHYESALGGVWDIRYSMAGDLQYREYFWDNPDCVGGEHYEITSESINLSGHSRFCQGAIDPVFDYFDPPLPIVRVGMKDGDIWDWEGHCAQDSGFILVTVAAEVITTPIGTMEVLHVHFTTFVYCLMPFYDLYLHPWYGPVREDDRVLIGWDGPVAVESRTWSNVKAMFE